MSAAYPDAEARRRTVLVAVVNNDADLRRAASGGWYRIPQRSAPQRIGADYLALYQTGAFEGAPEAQTITYYAATRRYRLMTRRELIPEEAGHPRAADYYFRIDLGPLQRLEPPVPSATLRRITFIHTTLDRLLHAQDVRELFIQDDPFLKLWHALRANRLRPLKNRLVDERPVDITLRARGGNLGIVCAEPPPPSIAQAGRPAGGRERWKLLWLSAAHIEQDLDGCLRQIGAALLSLGGSVLNQSMPVEQDV
ncbi:MAG TPA: hypothetical protein VNK95_15835 [Caldilineaceae bacterium]|nr:hypothetical protein [Caldilineaceae bacterium]